MAAQSIGEPGTQLTMRTFHIGGAAQKGAERSSVEANIDGKVEIRNKNVVKNSEGVTSSWAVTPKSSERQKGRRQSNAPCSIRRASAGRRCAKVKAGQKLAEWDPYTFRSSPKKTVWPTSSTSWKASRVDKVDEATGISSKVVIDWRSQPQGWRPEAAYRAAGQKGQVIKLPNGLPANYYLSVDSVLSVENGQEVKAGDIVARIPRETSKTRDITGGLPRVAELFEARRPKDFAIISEIDGHVEFGKDYKSKRRIVVKPGCKSEEPREYLIPKGRHLAVHEGDFVRKGDPLARWRDGAARYSGCSWVSRLCPNT
jgi:DNA-directed RNA polymerase subunit beta'